MADLEPGTVFAGFTIERLLGTGGMGSVYLAAHPRIPRKVGLKLLHRSLTDDMHTSRMFEREADHAARLDHPNIVSVLDRGRDGDQLWIAMQYVPGINAATAIVEGRVNTAQAIHIVSEIAKALDYAHENGVLHRDVKPANILLEQTKSGDFGRVMLADFGIAKALTESVNRTKSAKLFASLQFAAPEQFEDGDLDRRADVYALGGTLYNLLTGSPPYGGTSLPALMRAHLHDPVPVPSDLRPDLPRGLDAVVGWAMAKRPGDRFSTCSDLARAASAASAPARPAPTSHTAQPQPASPPPPSPAEAGQATLGPVGTTPTRPVTEPADQSVGDTTAVIGRPAPKGDAPRSTARWWILGVLAAIVVAAIVVGVILLGGKGDDSDAAAGTSSVSSSVVPSTTMIGADRATYTVSGGLYEKLQSLTESQKVDLGPPLGAEKINPDGKYQWFVGGVIIQKTGESPHVVWGEIRKKWNELGGSQGQLGYPTSDELKIGNARVSSFEHGTITYENGRTTVEAK